MREKTIAYFLAEVTRGKGNGDCILLENIDSNGNKIHALIDSGPSMEGGGGRAVISFLQKHKVKKLQFICVTHYHGDHSGAMRYVLINFKVDLLIMKEYDSAWSPGGHQSIYESLVKLAINNNIKVLGISYESLLDDDYSPSMTDTFKSIIKSAKPENFESFNENNIHFEFGSAFVEIINWEMFDTEGNLFVTSQNIKEGKKVFRAICNGENENSMGVLLFQGNKKALFTGDMNNISKNVGGQQIGDEDRLKNKIGKVDFLKFGHHGYGGSNTSEYMKVISPDYGVITNDVSLGHENAYKYIEKNKDNFLYSTQDEYEVSATIYNDEVTLGFGTPGIKKVREKIVYIPENKINCHYLKCNYEIKYDFVEMSVNNWEELKTAIEEYRSGGIYVNNICFIGECLKIYLNVANNNNIYIANSTININNYQNIHLVSNKNEIIIKRDETLIANPLFNVQNSFLTLGEENMTGKIIIDGNKDNVTSTTHLIRLNNSDLAMYDNILLCNNISQLTHRYKNTDDSGSAISAINYSKINLYGGEISNNIQEVFIDKNMESSLLPENMDEAYYHDAKGVAIYLKYSTLNFFGGKICNNKALNNSEIYSNDNSTNENKNLGQRIMGSAIFAEIHSTIRLYKGEISDNISINNSKTNLITPKNDKITNLNVLNTCIYGSALYCNNGEFEMYDDFLIDNNSFYLNTTIDIEENCKVNGGIDNRIRGGQIFLTSTKIKINGGIVQNSNNFINSIASSGSSNIKGGATDIINCQNIEINNLKVRKSNANTGGGLFLDSSSQGIISNSEFSYNTAIEDGGAIYMNKSGLIELYNNKIINNRAEGGSGGGIFANGELLIDGEKTNISNNEASAYGGGIILKNKATINNCTN